MTTTIEHDSPASAVPFYDARWTTKWLLVGLAVLLLFRSIPFVDREWLRQFPPWLVVALTGGTLQVFLLVYPIVTCDSSRGLAFRIPPLGRWLIEFAIAVPVVLAATIVMALANYLVEQAAPGTSLRPELLNNMARSPNYVFVFALLLFACTFAPIAEEVFFRGFLQNAFRARLPFIVAVFAQSLLFGFAHTYGAAHASATFVLGLLLTLVYEWRKTLLAPILVHAGINFLTALGTLAMMFAYANSPVMGVIGDPQDAQCVVHKIAPQSAAEEAGIQVGDIITSFNTEPIRSFPHLGETVQRYRAGDHIPVKLNRSGAELEVIVVLRRRGTNN